LAWGSAAELVVGAGVEGKSGVEAAAGDVAGVLSAKEVEGGVLSAEKVEGGVLRTGDVGRMDSGGVGSISEVKLEKDVAKGVDDRPPGADVPPTGAVDPEVGEVASQRPMKKFSAFIRSACAQSSARHSPPSSKNACEVWDV